MRLNFYDILQEEKQKRLGPGGLDPVDVFESLPEVRHLNGIVHCEGVQLYVIHTLNFHV